MIRLKKELCAVLPLVLKRKWYDMIESGEKKEEYRDFTPFWQKRIENFLYLNPGKNYVVAFQRGYKKPSMWFTLYGIATRSPEFCQSMWKPKTEWGEPLGKHYAIYLCDRVELVG